MKITVKRITNAPADALWKYIGDFSRVDRFHPMVKTSHFVDGSASCEVGSTRQCNFEDGNVLKERISEWKDGSHYTIDIIESSMPVKDASATVGVKSLGGNQSESYMIIKMTPKMKIMQPMMFMMFKYKVMPAVLKGLEDLYLEEQKSGSKINMAS